MVSIQSCFVSVKVVKRSMLVLEFLLVLIIGTLKRTSLNVIAPNREQILKAINEQEQKYTEQILEYSVEQREYSPTSLIEAVAPTRKSKTVDDLFNDYIAQLKNEGRLGYALSVQQVHNSLLKFKGHLDIYFSEIDVNWLKAYESWLRCCKLEDNTIGIRFRTLRAVYNLAVIEGIVKADLYPFKKYKVSKLHKKDCQTCYN